MKAKKTIDYKTIENDVDTQILTLFFELNYVGASERKKDSALKRLALIHALAQKSQTAQQLSEQLEFSKAVTQRTLRRLSKSMLVEASKQGRSTVFGLSSKGVIVLVAFREWQSFVKLQGLLAVPSRSGDKLAYALLVVGNCSGGRDDGLFLTLSRFVQQGGSFERLSQEEAAVALLRFCSLQAKDQRSYPTNYLGVFKEFTTSGFQEILRLLLTAMKPTINDYNWLIEFFNATGEFYFNPERLAYINLLAKDEGLKQRLEQYRKSQETQVKKQGAEMEVTFNVPSNLERYPTMPPYLKAIVMRLILEPTQFLNQELNNYFFNPQNKSS